MTQPELSAERLAALRTGNQQRMAALAQLGVGLNLVPQLVDFLIEAILDDDEKLEFFTRWEEHVAGMLAEIESQAARARLLQGLPR